jgi:hypothetical protein
VYEQVIAIETGFEQALRVLRGLRRSTGFEPSEVERLRVLTAEARAATLSYLTSVVETVETDDAARLQSRRLKHERREGS